MTDLLDRRQRVAAANLLIGFNLPAPLDQSSDQMIQAASICPGITTGEMVAMNHMTRRLALLHARNLINQMLQELDQ